MASCLLLLICAGLGSFSTNTPIALHLDTIRNGIVYEPLARSDSCYSKLKQVTFFVDVGLIAFLLTHRPGVRHYFAPCVLLVYPWFTVRQAHLVHHSNWHSKPAEKQFEEMVPWFFESSLNTDGYSSRVWTNSWIKQTWLSCDDNLKVVS